ncbi:LysR family transcriptional regulator [Cerasicoccus arenae]|uniref:LysR family transcriptional regulator n=1 Tax=Cerasicoccus arenae TaxID=424488 RepID=A0A8J3DFJ3_9BACT|nr:LysR family transcriptional regulator [Cerasicoccus arenae]MBK1859589.1 LysR family transcriptional regulator [Cerasicoccus arenae]GHB92892.1 LysR family transcriptional regulator [Cerasicoccus arenae]
MSLDFHQLRTFCAVAEEENVSRAAVRLYLSPPAVSAHIKALEDELGVRLFTRSSRGMALTEPGRSLWEDAESILKQVATLRRKANMLGDDVSGTLRIGVNNPPETLYTDEIISRLSAQFSTLRFNCTFGPSQFMLNGLRQDEFDIAFFEGQQTNPDIQSISLEERRVLLIAPKAWAPALRNAAPARLQEYPWIFASEGCSLYKFTQDWRTAHQLNIDERIRGANEEHSTMNFVARELGLSVIIEEVMNHSIYRDQVEVIPQLSGIMPLSLGFRKNRRDEALIQAAIQTITAIWQEKTFPALTT